MTMMGAVVDMGRLECNKPFVTIQLGGKQTVEAFRQSGLS